MRCLGVIKTVGTLLKEYSTRNERYFVQIHPPFVNGLDFFMSMDETYLEVPQNIKSVFAGAEILH